VKDGYLSAITTGQRLWNYNLQDFLSGEDFLGSCLTQLLSYLTVIFGFCIFLDSCSDHCWLTASTHWCYSAPLISNPVCCLLVLYLVVSFVKPQFALSGPCHCRNSRAPFSCRSCHVVSAAVMHSTTMPSPSNALLILFQELLQLLTSLMSHVMS
jgi:hypothetical protein